MGRGRKGTTKDVKRGMFLGVADPGLRLGLSENGPAGLNRKHRDGARQSHAVATFWPDWFFVGNDKMLGWRYRAGARWSRGVGGALRRVVVFMVSGCSSAPRERRPPKGRGDP